MARSRRRIYTEETGRHRASWAAPVLYSNLPDGLLFDRGPDGALHQRRSRLPDPGPPEARSPVVAYLPEPWYSESVTATTSSTRCSETSTRVLITTPRHPSVISGLPGSGARGQRWRRLCAASTALSGSLAANVPSPAIRVSRRRPPLSGPLPIQPTMGWGIEGFYQQLVEALPISGIRQAWPYEQSDLVRAASRHNRYLVVIDDVDELRGLTMEELADRLPAPTTIIVTSHLPVEGAALGVKLRQLRRDRRLTCSNRWRPACPVRRQRPAARLESSWRA